MISLAEAIAQYFESFEEAAQLVPNGILTDTCEDGAACITGGEITDAQTDITGRKTSVHAFEMCVTLPARTHVQRAAAHTALENFCDAVYDAVQNDLLPETGEKTCEALECGAPALSEIYGGGSALYTVPFNITVSERN